MISALRSHPLAHNAAQLKVMSRLDPAKQKQFASLIAQRKAANVAEAKTARQADGDACVETTLDNLGALLGVERLVVVPADTDARPPVAQVMESDTAFRARIQLAPEAFTTAGTPDAILARALEADGRVRSASVQSPEPGDVEVYVLVHDGDGTPDAATIAAVDAYLQSRWPLAIRFTTLAAQVLPYAIEVELVLRPGPAAGPVIDQAQAAAAAFARRHHELGRDVTLSALHAALYIEGATYDVRIVLPAANILVGEHQAAFCAGITLTLGGRDV